MANPDARFGFAPVGHLLGLNWSSSLRECYIHASYATALFIGDPVDFQPETDYQDTTANKISIEQASAGNGEYILGVIASFSPLRTDLTKQYNPASTERYAHVVVDPFVIYHIRDDGAATPTKLFPGENANIIMTHTGSTTTGLSGVELDTNSDGPDADSSNQLLILNAAPIEDNPLGTNTVWEVLINLHRMRATGDGDGMLGVVAT